MNEILFVMTVDTEADHQAGDVWRRSDPLTFHSVTEGLGRRLAPRLESLGARPTFLVTYEVLGCPAAVETLGRFKNCELGTHLHGECVPPDSVECAGILPRDLQCFYPRDLERAKLASLTQRFKAAFGYRPRAFRAGAYGADGETMALLGELDYRVDSSVTPHMRWALPQGTLDFTAAPEQPYWPACDDISRPGDERQVLQVPVTVSVLRTRSFIRKRPFWLRPSVSTADQMRRVIDDYLARYRAKGNVVLNMMFHSMELVPNASPYTRTEEEAQEMLRRIERVLAFVASQGARFVTLSELAERWSKEDGHAA
jgi:hypothetical protein